MIWFGAVSIDCQSVIIAIWCSRSNRMHSPASHRFLIISSHINQNRRDAIASITTACIATTDPRAA